MSDANTEITNQILTLIELMRKEGVTDGDIARKGGITRQSLHRREESGSSQKIVTFGVAIMRTGFQMGYAQKVLSILGGREFTESTILNAVLAHPDITEAEVAKLYEMERLLGIVPLPADLVEKTISSLRAPPP